MRLWMQGSDGRARGRRPRTAILTGIAILVAGLSWAVVALASGSAPTTVTEPANAVARTSAVLEGTVNPHGSQVTECVFRYGTTPVLEKSAPCSYSPGKGVTPVPVEAAVSGLSESTPYFFAVYAKNAEGESHGEQRPFTTLPTAPRSNINGPREVGRTAATLEGAVTPNESEVTECYFEWGTTPSSLENHAACSPSPGSGAAQVPVSARIEGLSETTTYYYRLVSHNSFGTDTSGRENVITLPNQPNATIEAANPVGRTTANLQGKVNPRESLVEQCFFSYGTSPTELENTVPCSSLPGSGSEPVPVEASVSGLSESTTYYYKLTASNAFGSNTSGNHQVTTEPTLPRVQGHKLDEVAARSAVLRGQVDPEDTTLTECFFEYGTTPAFGGVIPCSTVPSGEGFTKVTARVTGLSPATPYVYRLVASNAFGTNYGPEERFTTFETGLLPTVTKLSPKKGVATGGTEVKIKGKNLLEVQTVRFGGVESEGIVADTSESVTAIAPPGAGIVDVTVTTPDGSSELASGDRYTYGVASISSVSPSSGPIAGGTEVTVKGAGFATGAGETQFLFNNGVATSVVCASLNECTMISPPEAKGKAKTVKVKAVVIGKMSKTNPAAVFTYTP